MPYLGEDPTFWISRPGRFPEAGEGREGPSHDKGAELIIRLPPATKKVGRVELRIQSSKRAGLVEGVRVPALSEKG